MRPLVVAAAPAAALTLSVACLITPAAALTPTHLPISAGPAKSRPTLPTERSLLAVPPRGVGDLYAINDLTHHVVRFDLRKGRWQTSLIGTSLSNPVALVVTRQGVAWIADGATKKLVRVAADGTERTVRTISDTEEVSLTADRKGAVYFNDGNTIFKVSRSGRTIKTLGSVHPAAGGILGLGPDNAGHVIAVYEGDDRNGNQGTTNIDAASFTTSGGAEPTIRHLSAFSIFDSGVYGVQVGPTGAIILKEASGGGSGYTGLLWFAPGSSQAKDPTLKLSDSVGAFDSRGLLYVMENRVKCIGPEPGCTNDNAVDQVIVYPAAGGDHETIPTSNLMLPYYITADTRGRIWASGSGKLQTIPPAGGPAYSVLAGSFFDLQAPPGK